MKGKNPARSREIQSGVPRGIFLPDAAVLRPAQIDCRRLPLRPGPLAWHGRAVSPECPDSSHILRKQLHRVTIRGPKHQQLQTIHLALRLLRHKVPLGRVIPLAKIEGRISFASSLILRPHLSCGLAIAGAELAPFSVPMQEREHNPPMCGFVVLSF
jgi:hypothetical protein